MSKVLITSSSAKRLIHIFKKERCQIALLQETHLSDLEHIKLRRNWVGQVFYSSFKSNSRGVAILVHRNLPFTLEKTISDKEGRYVLVSGHILMIAFYRTNGPMSTKNKAGRLI